MKARRDARVRAADGLGPVEEPAPRVLAVGAAEGPGAEGASPGARAASTSSAPARWAPISPAGASPRGMEVTLQDVSAEQIGKGIKAQGKLFARKFKTKPQRDAAKARLIADPNGDGHWPRRRRHRGDRREPRDQAEVLFARSSPSSSRARVLATNTSSLQIEDIAAALRRSGPPRSACTSSIPWRRCRWSRSCAGHRAARTR